MKPQFGDIYLVRFHPSVGSELKRFRPACILSSKISQIDARFSLIAPFTSILEPVHKAELLIENPALEKPSLLLTWYLKTIDVRRLERKLGELSLNQQKAVEKVVKSLFSRET